MAVHFFDSSALVKRYRHEAGSDRVAVLIDQAEQLVIARLAHVEVAAAIVRRARGATISPSDLAQVLAVLERDVTGSFDVVELDSATMQSAVNLAQTHALRGADAIQLACATRARSSVAPRDFIMVASDQELNAAATAEGMNVVDPTT
jgi:predicted nucleic acid-binding protein